MPDFNKTVLAVHAHPDDTEAFCGGTLALLKKNGFRVVIATMTPGGMGGVGTDEKETGRIRMEEARKAAEVIGAEYYCLEQRDGFVFDTVEARIRVIELIRKTGAGVVFTHLPFDYHSDHRATCSIVESAAMLSTLENVPTDIPPVDTTPLLYHTEPFGYTDSLGREVPEPSFFIDVTTVFDTKVDMLSRHESQIALMKRMFGIDDFFMDMRDNDKNLGAIAGVSYAEAYWQHLGAGFYKDPLIQETLKEYRRR